MAKEQKIIGLSPDLIIHPGETLAEILEDRDMSQKELAVRTGMTEKHISTVVKGQKRISVAFAKKLEYALGIDASFWINIQANCDRELLEFEEVNNIRSDGYGYKFVMIFDCMADEWQESDKEYPIYHMDAVDDEIMEYIGVERVKQWLKQKGE